MNMPPRTAAFTLLEMMVVLAIGALVIGIGTVSVQRLTEEHELLKVAHEAEKVCMQSMTRTLATAQGQQVNLETLSQGAKLTLKRFGASVFIGAKDQYLLMRPGGLCEPRHSFAPDGRSNEGSGGNSANHRDGTENLSGGKRDKGAPLHSRHVKAWRCRDVRATCHSATLTNPRVARSNDPGVE